VRGQREVLVKDRMDQASLDLAGIWVDPALQHQIIIGLSENDGKCGILPGIAF